MQKLLPPKNADGNLFSARIEFLNSIRTTRSAEMRQRLEKLAHHVERADIDNSRFAERCALKNTPKFKPSLSRVRRLLMRNYDEHFARKGSAGRPCYDQIIQQPRHRECPYCEVGRVTTLDHFLPKENFPLLAVAPMNLVPCCRDCQAEKASFFPHDNEQQILHPYFDPIGEQWIKAEFDTSTKSFKYSVSCPSSWSAEQVEAARQHFKIMKLGLRFSEEAAERMIEFESQCRGIFRTGGADSLREYFRELSADADRKGLKLSLRAMLKACFESAWLCEQAYLE